MELQATLSDEELACFSELFRPPIAVPSTIDGSEHYLSVSTEIPKVLGDILGKAKMTLLAEVGHYKLWFPVFLERDELGQFNPSLGTPEVLDIRGGERSWRLRGKGDIQLIDDDSQHMVDVLSLSSSGMTLNLGSQGEIPMFRHYSEHSCRYGKLVLPEGENMRISFTPIRFSDGIMAATISLEPGQQARLRQFLFDEHKHKYLHLYQKPSC
ncbi:hypothetical protein [Shewanella sp. SR44-3]|uniref:hypothetical protein n=1 Tax=unclassified Shewanella TaxID=196818 RepID=UPI0015F7A8CB|nr:hypothetical protein [Shewanella sp. SR44-3]MBB1269080.1 hypothetical protein [Shewanella sp. SR44-3]